MVGEAPGVAAVMRSIFLLLPLIAACSTPARTARVAPAGTPQLAVMTYNVNYGLPGDAATLAAIRMEPVDVVLLQETNEEWESAIRADAELANRYPHRHFLHCCLAGGLGVLSRREIREVEPLKEVSWFPALRVVVATPVGDVQMLAVHLRPQISDKGSVVFGYLTTPPIRKEEMITFARSLDPALPTLIAGDFNESGGGALEILEARGFTSVLPEFAPSATTWRWQTSVGEVTSTLDHIAYEPKKLEPLDAVVHEIGRSDHLPIIARFVRTKG